LRKGASRRPSVCLAIPSLPLGSVTDTLNYNWDFFYVEV